jgi:hypothetical protein
MHAALLQSAPATPGGDPVIRVFAAWPAEWDAAFSLLTAGAFLVTSSMRAGRIEFVELDSNAGSACRIWNPWPESPVTVYRNGNKAEEVRGPQLTLNSTRGETLILVPSGSAPDQFKRALPA